MNVCIYVCVDGMSKDLYVHELGKDERKVKVEKYIRHNATYMTIIREGFHKISARAKSVVEDIFFTIYLCIYISNYCLQCHTVGNIKYKNDITSY